MSLGSNWAKNLAARPSNIYKYCGSGRSVGFKKR